ncbi:uncharacterized protein METZ01_LOCUS245023, partial [marine metagenome]
RVSFLIKHRGKPYKVALIACARKILVWSWEIFVNNTTFDTTITSPFPYKRLISALRYIGGTHLIV